MSVRPTKLRTLEDFNHLRYVHSADASFFVLCNINSCKSRFTSLRTYRRHIISKHKWFWQKNWGGKSDKISVEESEVEDFEDTAATSDYDTSVNDSALEEIPKEVDFEDLVSEFLLKLREVKKVSGVACNFVATEIQSLVDLLLATQAKDILGIIKDLNVGCPELESYVRNMCCNNLTNACQKFSYQKALNNKISQKINYVAPVKISPSSWFGECCRFKCKYI